MAYSGKLIVRCFHNVPEASQTYYGVGFHALDGTFNCGGKPLRLGPLGKALVTVGVLLEFLGAACIVMISIWDNVSYLLPQVDVFYIAVVASCAVLPTCWYAGTF